MLTHKFAEFCKKGLADTISLLSNGMHPQHAGLFVAYVGHQHLGEWLKKFTQGDYNNFAACEWWREQDSIDVPAFIQYMHNQHASGNTNACRFEFFKWTDRLLAKEHGNVDNLLRIRQLLKEAPPEVCLFLYVYTYFACEDMRREYNQKKRR